MGPAPRSEIQHTTLTPTARVSGAPSQSELLDTNLSGAALRAVPSTRPDISIVIPVFNEAAAISGVVDELWKRYPGYEILVVDDGSTDDSVLKLKDCSCRLLRHKTNRGYGAALKTGVRAARGRIVVFYDGDGQFDPADVGRLIERMSAGRADIVLSERQSSSYQPPSRRLGKLVMRKTANTLAGMPIPDPNCGLRAIKRDLLLAYLPLLPDTFSASTTTTLLFLKRGYSVCFLPIVVRKRLGKSSANQLRDGSNTILLMLRLIALFDPLKIFLPTAAILAAFGVVYSLYEALFKGLGVPVLGAVIFISGMLCFFLGIVCDQISALRLERYEAPLRSEKDDNGEGADE